ncbi:MAG: hypothetical protein ACLFVJ_04560 [Persicimonas sp.]
MDITSEQTKTLWREMCAHYGTRVVPKSGSPLMRGVGAGLHVIRIMDYRTFMDRYTTVLGRRIYPWFDIGEGDEDALWYQAVVCVHEHQHVVQARREGFVGFSIPYLLSPKRRALLEAEAYRCNLEMHWWKNAEMPDPDRLAGRLEQYGCGQKAVAAARDYLQAAAKEVRQGEVLNEASRFAIDLLGAAG